jgi:multidrug resistance efflux pump
LENANLSREFKGLGFGIAKYVLLGLLILFGLLVSLSLILGWHLGMEVAVDAEGIIRPSRKFVVKSRSTGILGKVHVKQGQVISVGEILAEIDDQELSAKLDKVELEIEVQNCRLDELESRVRQERKVLEAQINATRAEIETAELHLQQVRGEYKLYFATYPPLPGNRRKPLDDLLPVLLNRSRVRRTKAELVRGQRELDALDARRQEMTTLIKSTRILEEERRYLLKQLSRTRIASPANGTVLTNEIDKREGDLIRGGETLLEIAPLENWSAQVFVREFDIPKVQEGQSVRLYVEAFPHMEYRILEGSVKEVPVRPTEETLNTPEPVYPVKIEVGSTDLSDGEQTFSLAYGMRVSAKIIIERGRVFDLIRKKINKAAGDVFRPGLYVQE